MENRPWYSRDLKHPGWIIAKGVLFLALAGFATVLSFSCRGKGYDFAAYFTVSVWAYCRSYYFAFYVITNYVDSGYKYSGLWNFMM